jgi:hypothetical protein
VLLIHLSTASGIENLGLQSKKYTPDSTRRQR